MIVTKPLLEDKMLDDVSGNEDWNISFPFCLVRDRRDDGVAMAQSIDRASTLNGVNETGMFTAKGGKARLMYFETIVIHHSVPRSCRHVYPFDNNSAA